VDIPGSFLVHWQKASCMGDRYLLVIPFFCNFVLLITMSRKTVYDNYNQLVILYMLFTVLLYFNSKWIYFDGHGYFFPRTPWNFGNNQNEPQILLGRKETIYFHMDIEYDNLRLVNKRVYYYSK